MRLCQDQSARFPALGWDSFTTGLGDVHHRDNFSSWLSTTSSQGCLVPLWSKKMWPGKWSWRRGEQRQVGDRIGKRHVLPGIGLGGDGEILSSEWLCRERRQSNVHRVQQPEQEAARQWDALYTPSPMQSHSRS